jgi:hypothetical protein
MRKHAICLAAAMAAGTFGLSNWAAAQNMDNQQNHQNAESTTPGAAGGTMTEERMTPQQAQHRDLQRVLSSTVEGALSKDGGNNLSRHLTRDDQRRIGDLAQDNQQLQEQIDTFARNWREKYDEDFSIRDQEMAFSSIRFEPGDMTDRARTAGEREEPTGADRMGEPRSDRGPDGNSPAVGANPRQAGDRGIPPESNAQHRPGDVAENVTGERDAGITDNRTEGPAVGANPRQAGDRGVPPESNAQHRPGDVADELTRDADRRRTDDGDAGMAGDRAVATDQMTIVVPASHGMPEVRALAVREGATWKLDLPDTVDGQRLQANLTRHIQMINNDKANWPADKNDAYMLVSHHVLAALTDSERTGAGAGANGAMDR